MTEQEQTYGTSRRTKYLLIGVIVVLAFAMSYGIASARSGADAAQQVATTDAPAGGAVAAGDEAAGGA
jgi:hypothetical protein